MKAARVAGTAAIITMLGFTAAAQREQADRQKYTRMDAVRMKQDVEAITALTRRAREPGSKYWGRIAGTKGDKDVEQFMAARFKAIGLQDVHMQSFDLPPQWFPAGWEVSATGAARTLALTTAFPAGRSPATSAAGLDLDVVWVGNGSALDFAGRDVSGKAVLIQTFPTPSAFRHTAGDAGALRRAVEKGAAAVLLNLAIPGNVINQMGGADGLPTFAISSDETAQLTSMMENGPVRVHVKLAVEMRSGLTDANVWGTLPGATDEEIVVFAHHDGFFESAFDNASGTATMLGVAEHFATLHQSQRRRTLRFVSTAAHHAGSPGTRWMYDERDGAMKKAVLYLNSEHTSIIQSYLQGQAVRRSDAINARRWFVHGSPKLTELALAAYETFGVTTFEGMESNASGDMGPIQRERPVLQLITSPLYYHSDHDLASDVPAEGLAAVAKAYAKIIDEVNTLQASELQAPVPAAAR